MASHYLFFEQFDTASLIDVMRPRQRPGEKKIRSFSLEPEYEERYGDLAFIVMNDGQLQRIREKARPAVNTAGRPPIHTIRDMVTAELVDFTSMKLEKGIRTYRADFFSPETKEQFAYASTYGTGRFAQRMLAERGLELEMLKFVNYQQGQPISEAIKGTFATYYSALANNSAFQIYQGRSLALVVPSKLIEK
ncbi:MAG: hypothetical protein AABX35_01570 [Nanoarchaeota archaeon]